MPTKAAVLTDKAPPPLPFFSQGIICNGMVYCSGSIGMDPDSKAMVESGVGDRTVSEYFEYAAGAQAHHVLRLER